MYHREYTYFDCYLLAQVSVFFIALIHCSVAMCVISAVIVPINAVVIMLFVCTTVTNIDRKLVKNAVKYAI